MAVTIKSSALRAPKAGEIIAAELRRQIVSRELQEGDPLPSEAELMDQFGVSRPTLREAIRVLESERIVRVKRGNRGGAYVLVPDSSVAGRHAGTLLQYQGTTMADLHSARAQLESACVGELARARTAAQLRELDKLLSSGEQLLTDPNAYGMQHELQFHRRLVEMTGNQTMLVLLDMLFSIVDMQNQSYMKTHPVDASQTAAVRASHRAHVKVVELIRAKAGEEAMSLWRKHLTKTGEFVSDPGQGVIDILP